jgi:hypothetical protein
MYSSFRKQQLITESWRRFLLTEADISWVTDEATLDPFVTTQAGRIKLPSGKEVEIVKPSADDSQYATAGQAPFKILQFGSLGGSGNRFKFYIFNAPDGKPIEPEALKAKILKSENFAMVTRVTGGYQGYDIYFRIQYPLHVLGSKIDAILEAAKTQAGESFPNGTLGSHEDEEEIYAQVRQFKEQLNNNYVKLEGGIGGGTTPEKYKEPELPDNRTPMRKALDQIKGKNLSAYIEENKEKMLAFIKADENRHSPCAQFVSSVRYIVEDADATRQLEQKLLNSKKFMYELTRQSNIGPEAIYKFFGSNDLILIMLNNILIGYSRNNEICNAAASEAKFIENSLRSHRGNQTDAGKQHFAPNVGKY